MKLGETVSHTAKMQHWCSGCGFQIAPGRRYSREVFLIKDENRVIVRKYHSSCQSTILEIAA